MGMRCAVDEHHGENHRGLYMFLNLWKSLVLPAAYARPPRVQGDTASLLLEPGHRPSPTQLWEVQLERQKLASGPS